MTESHHEARAAQPQGGASDGDTQSKPLPSQTVEVHRFRKNTRETLVTTLQTIGSGKTARRIVSVRAWVPMAEGEARPGKAGLAVQIGQIDELIAALSAAKATAAEIGWLAGAEPATAPASVAETPPSEDPAPERAADIPERREGESYGEFLLRWHREIKASASA